MPGQENETRLAHTVGLHFRYTEEEFSAATRLYLLRTPALFARLTLFAALLNGGLFLLLLATTSAATACLMLALVAPLLLYSLFYVQPRTTYAHDPRFKEEFHWQFSEAGITQKTSLSESNLRWELFTNVLVNRRFYLLSYGKHMFTLIPRRAFATPAQEAAFVALLRRKITPDFNTKSLPADPTRALDSYTPPTAPPDWR